MKTIIFDFWHTLAYRPRLTPIVMKYKNAPKAKLKDLFEDTLQLKKWKNFDHMFDALVKGLNADLSEKDYKEFKKKLTANFFNSALYSDVKETLEGLKKHRLILLSNATQFDKQQAEKFGITKYFDKCFYSYEMKTRKPEAFDYIIKKLKLNPKDCIMVGDSYKHDYLGAKKAGMNALYLDRAKTNQGGKDRITRLKQVVSRHG